MSWDSFLKSLETDGGKLFVTLFMLMWLTIIEVIMVMTKHIPQESGRQMLLAADVSLLTILYGYLKPSGSPPAKPQ